ncbi:unnamed protein product [Soboliphyme baturini]|uniref:Calpain catalytic domain-containing protein n=1 Tax=Soboliphyme baturini TaxID=241478 RepID=A0A183J294_9BILA|nr:unnamed protein product [Soboliphyme baturini]
MSRSRNYSAIKRQCEITGKLWEDPDFPAADQSLFYSKKLHKKFVWKRPKEINVNAKFVERGFERFDIKQGELGDCWLLAAVANLTLYEELLFTVVPRYQSFGEGYCGIFYFNFWQYGEWVEVCVDDRLPTVNGELVFMHSAEGNEFWSALLEKAYAKLCGSYENLQTGSASESMEDFTGGIAERFDLRDPKQASEITFMDIVRAVESRSLLCCSIDVWQRVLFVGLVKGHEYSITAVKRVNMPWSLGSKVVELIRLRNPWGEETEWNGPWSDRSKEWNWLTEQQKKDLDLTFASDGEFWMTFGDFKRYFERLEICHVCHFNDDNSTADPASVRGKCDELCERWRQQSFNGSWIKGKTAGGCGKDLITQCLLLFLESFARNPQFQFSVTRSECTAENDCSNCIIALMQKYRRRQHAESNRFLHIGFAVYKVDDAMLYNRVLDYQFFANHESASGSRAFINIRENCQRFRLEEGRYVVIPSTYDPDVEGEFLLRIYCKNPDAL